MDILEKHETFGFILFCFMNRAETPTNAVSKNVVEEAHTYGLTCRLGEADESSR